MAQPWNVCKGSAARHASWLEDREKNIGRVALCQSRESSYPRAALVVPMTRLRRRLFSYYVFGVEYVTRNGFAFFSGSKSGLDSGGAFVT